MYRSGHEEGAIFEQYLTGLLHSRYTPVLVDMNFLRKKGAGQVDVVVYDGSKIVIIEGKTSHFPAKKQLKRLYLTANYLSSIFNKNTVVKVILRKKSGMMF